LVRHCKYSCLVPLFELFDLEKYRDLEIWLRGHVNYVIKIGTIRKLECGFLFAFHSNYGCILHRFKDKAIYWSKSARADDCSVGAGAPGGTG